MCLVVGLNGIPDNKIGRFWTNKCFGFEHLYWSSSTCFIFQGPVCWASVLGWNSTVRRLNNWYRTSQSCRQPDYRTISSKFHTWISHYVRVGVSWVLSILGGSYWIPAALAFLEELGSTPRSPWPSSNRHISCYFHCGAKRAQWETKKLSKECPKEASFCP